jgi:hypothetical protein
VEVLNFLLENWEFIFLLVFKFLRDIDSKLDKLHIDNAVKHTSISNLEKRVDKLETRVFNGTS